MCLATCNRQASLFSWKAPFFCRAQHALKILIQLFRPEKTILPLRRKDSTPKVLKLAASTAMHACLLGSFSIR